MRPLLEQFTTLVGQLDYHSTKCTDIENYYYFLLGYIF